MALLRNKLFAGALFAGALLGSAQFPVEETAASISYSGSSHDTRKATDEDDDRYVAEVYEKQRKYYEERNAGLVKQPKTKTQQIEVAKSTAAKIEGSIKHDNSNEINAAIHQLNNFEFKFQTTPKSSKENQKELMAKKLAEEKTEEEKTQQLILALYMEYFED